MKKSCDEKHLYAKKDADLQGHGFKGIIFCEWEASEASEIFKGLAKVGIKEGYEIYEVEDIEPHKCCNSIFGEVD